MSTTPPCTPDQPQPQPPTITTPPPPPPLQPQPSPPLPPELRLDHGGWTFADNKLFERALTELDLDSASFFEDMARELPWKTVDEIKAHYELLLDDLRAIENGECPSPDYYEDDLDESDYGEEKEEAKDLGDEMADDISPFAGEFIFMSDDDDD